MSRFTLVLPLLCAVAFSAANAGPYSKIPDNAQFNDGFASQTAAAGSLSSSSSFSQGNHAFSGSQASGYVSGGPSGYSSQVAYGAPAAGKFQAQVASGGKGELPFWWMGSESPFSSGGKGSSGGGCSSSGCSASTSFQSSGHSAAAHQEAKLQSNPFLNGFSGSQQSPGSSESSSFASSHSGASANSLQQIGAYGPSKNPFLTASSSNKYASAATGQSTQVSAGSFYQNSGTSGYDKPQQVANNAGNPFFQQQTPQLTQIGDTQVSGFPDPPVPIPQQNDKDTGIFKISCSGKDQICVPFHLCSYNGFVTAKGLTQVRSGPQECDTNQEVCCTLKPEDQAGAGSSSGGIFGPGNVNVPQQSDLSTGEIGNAGGSSIDAVAEGNGYLPPIGGSPSDQVPQFTDFPQEPEPEKTGSSQSPTPIFPPSPALSPQVGCAAALLCVEEKYCTLEGVISPEVQVFSSKQLIGRVPMTDCKNPDNGIIGKCCRDPNYVDPWPTGNLPANYSGGFDEQGFPTILNLTKTRPTKKRPYNGGSLNGPKQGIKTSFSTPVGVKTSPALNGGSSSPVFVQNNYPEPTPIAPAPYDGAIKSPRPFLPQQPTKQAPRPFVPQQQPQQPPRPFVPQQQPQRPFVPQQQPQRPFVPQQVPQKPFVPQQQPFVPQQQPQRPFVPEQQPFVPQQQPQRPFAPQQQPQRPFVPEQQPFVPQQQPQRPFAPQQQPQKPFVPPQETQTPFVPPQQSFVPPKQTPKPYVKGGAFAVSSSNQSPAIIASHAPGSQCGRRNIVQRPSGLTDVDVAFGEIPWQAMILSDNDKKLLCSGAIVAPNAVVTAARCIEGFNPEQISIKAGEWKLGYELKHEEPLPFEIIKVASIAPYPAFSSGNSANDIAILFLEHDMKLDQHVDVLCLPEGQPQAPKPGRKCIATGWGKTILQVHVAGALMHSIDVDVLGNEQCRERLSGAENQIPLDDSLFCAKAQHKNNNMCQVDFGGPLACDRGDGFYELVGIYSQDTGCLPTNQVTTFSTIPSQWIESMMANPPKYPNNEYLSPVSSGQNPFAHNHGPNVPCDCEGHELLPAGSSQYLPPVQSGRKS